MKKHKAKRLRKAFRLIDKKASKQKSAPSGVDFNGQVRAGFGADKNLRRI